MAKMKPSSTEAGAPKRTRKAQPKCFIVNLVGASEPVTVIATSKKSAMQAVMQIREASHDDIRESGHMQWRNIDLTTAPGQQSITASLEALRQSPISQSFGGSVGAQPGNLPDDAQRALQCARQKALPNKKSAANR